MGNLSSPTAKPPEIRIGKTTSHSPETGKEVEVFTMTLGTETIQLLPLRNWGQLDVYKWGVRGKLPGTPAGLEVSFDHVKLAGEIVSPSAPDGCAKLEKIFAEWLELEKATLAMTSKKVQFKAPAAAPSSTAKAAPQALRFHVEVDKREQVHIECLQGTEKVASIGLSPTGFTSLINQGLMRKPAHLKVGALHDWVELDGTLCSFERGRNDAAQLEKMLNEHYVPSSALGQGKSVVLFTNAASSTGFDIQFPITKGGVVENRRRHLGEEALELLQDSERCGLLQPKLQIKLTRPCLVFKEKTSDGGERYLQKSPEHTVTVTGDDGAKKFIDLSQPVNYMHLSAVELTAVFNHPAVNRHTTVQAIESPLPESTTAPPPATPVSSHPNAGAGESQSELSPQPPNSPALSLQPTNATPIERRVDSVREAPKPSAVIPRSAAIGADSNSESTVPLKPVEEKIAEPGQPASPAPEKRDQRPSPNTWLKALLEQEPIRPDWLTLLLYRRIAQKFGNSREGTFGDHPCWAIAMGPTKHITEPTFKGVFLTEKGGLGFLNEGYVARFNRGVAFLGAQESPIEGIGLNLLAVGLDASQRIVFIVNDNYRSKFDVPEKAIRQTQERLREHGAVVISTQEVLENEEPLEVLWTVPGEQPNPAEPQAFETMPPLASAEPPTASVS